MPSSWPSRPDASTINSAPPTSAVNWDVAEPFDQLHSPMNVIVHRFVVTDVQIARPQTHLHLISPR